MNEKRMSQDQIFEQIIQITDPQIREKKLNELCGNNQDLREAILDLVSRDQQMGSFLENPPTVIQRPESSENVGCTATAPTISNFNCKEIIGQGGMGTVWRAEQQKPVRRTVAVKLIRADYGAGQIISRFEAERQALAMMDHPNIAKVLGAGTTDAGAPYFVMELVNGTPLNRFCDEHNLDIRQRLNLFTQVCRAVQHAHQKGIVHRDLKPTNVLVEVADGLPIAKVIDFGLAKAIQTEQKLTDESLDTEHGRVLGTLQYMSPEQASSAKDIDTRADIYSLGVILFELLTGSTPLTQDVVQEENMFNVLEQLKSVEPIRPSIRVDSSGDNILEITKHRKISASRLQQILRGELDWIVLKALAFERDRRYQTASALAEDIQNYINGEVVTARPPSRRYRISKFVRRNRAGVVAASLISITLIAGIIATSYAMVKAIRAEALANSETQKKELALRNETLQKDYAEAVAQFLENDILLPTSVEGQSVIQDASSDTLNKETTLTELLNRAASKLVNNDEIEPFIKARLLSIVGNSLRANGDAASGIAYLRQALDIQSEILPEDDPMTLSTISSLALAYLDNGQLDAARPLFEKVLDLRQTNLGISHLDTLSSMNNLAGIYSAMGKIDEAFSMHTKALELMKSELGELHPETLRTMGNLATSYVSTGRPLDAIPIYERTLELMKQIHGAKHIDTLSSMFNLGGGYIAAGNYPRGTKLLRETLELQNEKLGEDHPDTLKTMNNLGRAYQLSGDFPTALDLFDRCLQLKRKKWNDDHPDVLTSMTNLASSYTRAGSPNKGLPLLEEVSVLMQKKYGEDHPDTLSTMHNLGVNFAVVGQIPRAIETWEKVLRLRKKKLGNDHPATLKSIQALAMGYSAAGQARKGLELLDQLLEIKTSRLGTDHPETLSLMDSIAQSYQKVGENNKAIRLWEKALEQLKIKPGIEHPITLACMNNLASGYYFSGDADKAIPIWKQSLELKIARFGNEHPDTFRGMANLAMAYATIGSFKEALELHKKVLFLRETKLGADHPDTLDSMQRIAKCYLSSDDFSNALPLFQKVLELRQNKLGHDHPETLQTMLNLGVTQSKIGNDEAAVPMVENAVKKMTQKLGRQHPETLKSMIQLAILFRKTEQSDDAIYLLEEVISLSKLDLITESASRELRRTLAETDRRSEFTKLVDLELERARTTFANNSVELAEVLLDVAASQLSIGELQSAERLAREGLQIYVNAAPDNWHRFDSQSFLGNVLLTRYESTVDSEKEERSTSNGAATESSESTEAESDSPVALSEIESLLVEAYDGLKNSLDEIPVSIRIERMHRTLDHLIRVAQLQHDSKKMKHWMNEKSDP